MRLSHICFMKTMSSITKTFLFWFSNEQCNFRHAELEALCKIFHINMDSYNNRRIFGPFVLMDLPSEDYAKKIMSRSVLAHHCIELWATAESMSKLHQNYKDNMNVTLPYKNNSFCIRVDTYGKKISLRKKIEFIETFDYLPIEGPVDLSNPELMLNLFQFYGMDPNNVPELPVQVFFGRWIADGQRHLVHRTSLKTRKFIGNTSMDPLLALVMANLALVKPHDIIFDPFVGTGSLLVAAAIMGGHIIGTDIDYLMLHGKTRPTRAKEEKRAEDESIHANFIQYGVQDQYLDILVADAALVDSSWRKDFKFDAIITDPPYGVREPLERIGTTKNYKIKEEHVALHIPSKINYSICDVITDLIDFSAKRLSVGGRIVVWVPVCREYYDEDKLPKNDCFHMAANCEQVLTGAAARRLLVMEKICEPTETTRTTIDTTSPMYLHFKLFEAQPTTTRRQRKENSVFHYGKTTKRGQVRE